jgi:hypothetical protein
MKFGGRSVTLNTLPEVSMKPIALTGCLALAALSLYAADPQASNEPQSPPRTHIQTQLSQQVVTRGDSPLVRAAKATNRLGRKPMSQVITNETLVHEGGHFTTPTSEVQALPTYAPGTASPEQAAVETRRKAEAEQAKKAADQRQATARAASEANSENLYSETPAAEGPMQPMKTSAPPPMSPTPMKPPS